MKELIALPVVMALILGTLTQLEDLAEKSSQKIEYFSQDMVNAIDCATAGIDIKVCSPNIYQYNFDNEINDTLNLTQRLELQFKENY